MKYYGIVLIALLFVNSINAQINTCKCCTESHSEFDFWIGIWEVTNKDGSVAGQNVIKKKQDNCILQEIWTSSTPGYTGTSNNYYNLKTKKWEQIWIDNQGGILHLKGRRIGNQMILRTDDEKNAQDETFFHRITWTANDDDSVHQLWETITNYNEITISFDGWYKRKD